MIVAGGNQVTGTTTQRVLTPGAARLVCNRANVKFFGHRHSRGGEWPSLGVTCYVRQSHNGDEGSAAGGVERGDDDNDAQAPALAVGVVSVHQRVCVGPLAAIGESETTTSDESECEGGLMFPPAEGETELWDVGMRVSCALIASRGGRRALSGGEFGLVFVDAVLVTEGVLQKCHDDSLIQRLLSIHSYINGHPSSQEIELCISRVDYMLDCSSKGKCELKHVESNTTSAAFSHFGSLVSDLHRYLCETHLVQLPYRNCVLPPNISHIKIPNSLAHAFRLYQIERPANSAVNTTQTICIIVSTSEQNCYEQRAIEFLLWEIHHISVKRYTLEEVALRGQLIGEKRLLIIDGCVEVAVSYYRIGILSSDLEFKAVEMIEQSYAIKCPTLVMLLLGTKKVQERLADPGVLERFLTSPSDQKTCKECFTAFLDVENPQSVQQAIKDPNDWVMKRQRGGGGNNLFGKQMVEALESSAISSYTIQKLIKPKARSTWVMTPTNDLPTLFNAVSELGIFGVLIRNKRTQQEIVNEAAGHLLRTKDISSSDGGVCNGLAVLDSPVLI
ncbi:glutathione synthetase [Pelomyxa schiedti]|nr:glutathione synthetase [Pelomyxa schiedti]